MSIKFKESVCPDCGGHIPMSWLSMWAFCSRCSRVWRVYKQFQWTYAKSVILEKVTGEGYDEVCD